MTAEQRFEAFCARKTREASAAALTPLRTFEDRSREYPVVSIGSAWTRRLYDGAFHLTTPPPGLPAISLVFVQSRDGNTVAKDPAVFGGGPMDKHFLYEGLCRAAADAVLAGSRTASGKDVFFSVWRPELVALRAALGLPRHPAQVVVTRSGNYDPRRLLAFDVPTAPVFIITTPAAREKLLSLAGGRPWVHVVATDSAGSLRDGLERLRVAHGITRISAVGGPHVATALIDEDLVQDVHLTTTSVEAGEPGTPFYRGARSLAFDTIVAKRGEGERGPILFEQYALC